MVCWIQLQQGLSSHLPVFQLNILGYEVWSQVAKRSAADSRLLPGLTLKWWVKDRGKYRIFVYQQQNSVELCSPLFYILCLRFHLRVSIKWIYISSYYKNGVWLLNPSSVVMRKYMQKVFLYFHWVRWDEIYTLECSESFHMLIRMNCRKQLLSQLSTSYDQKYYGGKKWKLCYRQFSHIILRGTDDTVIPSWCNVICWCYLILWSGCRHLFFFLTWNADVLTGVKVGCFNWDSWWNLHMTFEWIINSL